MLQYKNSWRFFMNKLINHLKDCVLFKDFTKKEIEYILNNVNYKTKEYSKEGVIALEENECSNIGIVINGVVEIKKIYSSGKVVTLSRLTKGDIFGEIIVFSDSNLYPATIISSVKSKIL